MRLQTMVAILLSCLAGNAHAVNGSVIAPWLPLTGQFTGHVEDARILGYPPRPAGPFFELHDSSIRMMTGDSSGWSRSASGLTTTCSPPTVICPAVYGTQQDADAAMPDTCYSQPGACVYGPSLAPGDFWENSGGGPGFSGAFCGG